MNRVYRVPKSALRCFAAGIFAVLPLMITVAAVVWVGDFLAGLFGPESFLGNALQRLGLQFASDSTVAYVFGWGLVLAMIFVLGVFVEMGAKRMIHGGIDSLVNRVPILSGIYGMARQLVGMMDEKESADLKGMSVVFCIFGKETGAAFLALLPTPQRFHVNGIDYHAVLVPTAPVPVGGSLIFVPADSVHRADLSVDAFMSVYVSMGVSGPEFLPKAEGNG